MKALHDVYKLLRKLAAEFDSEKIWMEPTDDQTGAILKIECPEMVITDWNGSVFSQVISLVDAFRFYSSSEDMMYIEFLISHVEGV